MYLIVFQLKMCIFVAAYERRAQRTSELLLGSKRVVCCIRQCAQAIFFKFNVNQKQE